MAKNYPLIAKCSVCIFAFFAVAQGALAFDLDQKLTLSAKRGGAELRGSSLNLSVPAETPNQDTNALSVPTSQGVVASTSSSNPIAHGLRLNQSYRAPVLVTPLSGHATGITLPVTPDVSVSVAETKIQGPVDRNDVTGLHLISKVDKNRKLFIGVEKIKSDVSETRAGMGVLFDLD